MVEARSVNVKKTTTTTSTNLTSTSTGTGTYNTVVKPRKRPKFGRNVRVYIQGQVVFCGREVKSAHKSNERGPAGTDGVALDSERRAW